MKYTVMIEQAVAPEALPQLEQLLTARFQLSPEQARKLASRRGGRLMKPTGRERASVLLEIFQEVGAQVRLEQVAEDAGGAAASSVPAPSPLSASPLNTPLSAASELHATEFGQVVAREPNVATLTAPAPAEAVTAAPAAAAMAPLPADSGDFWAELSAPATPGLAKSADGLFMPEGDLSAPKSAAVSADDALAAELFGAPASVAPAASNDADIWSDFTGALTITDSAPAETKAAEAAPELLLQPEPEVKVGRRRPLSRRMAIASVTPLAVYTALTLSTLAVVLTSAQRTLISNSAAAVAAAVGSVLNTTDQNTVNQQLGTLLNQGSVGFVQVELPDGTTFFRSQTPGVDSVLGERVGSWVTKNPVSGVFVQNQTPAELYNVQLQQLVSVGAEDSEPAAALKRAIEDPENRTIDNRNYQVERIGVYAKEDGTRETRPASQKSPNTLLYRIAVGVPIDADQAQLRNTLLTLLVAGLAAMLVGAALAARAARRVVLPIERLVKAADAISLGDLTHSVRPEANDEVGDLAQALERMRLSLDAAMERLRKRRKA
ncbi:HAMP domain-containing protein [Deinococcus irradiatisoli]|uniref:histidine kinase n=1 Tax=Deinococcus irradiatisoli TaxID=2202254 RepID=A0A2Z3JJ00_9DEIO|nr:HAMP domain-containing protein [Deinococcus irradiatisoli]AWN23340.1 HAMP domain-containing protein [Deinococcus irradiatisoli]